MKKISLVALAIPFIIAGCSSGHSLAGKWQSTGADIPAKATMFTTFTEPDKVAMTMDIPQDLPGGKTMQIHADVTGTYKVDGETLTLHADDVKFSGSGVPPEMQKLFDQQMSGMADKVKEQVNKEGTANMKWVDNDHITLTGTSGKPETLARVK